LRLFCAMAIVDSHGASTAGNLVSWLALRKQASLELFDGSIFQGWSFGHTESTNGEVCFNTGMVGYPESLTDPSYAGQILVITFPLVGNYGVPGDEEDNLGLSKNFESEKIHVKAVVIADYSYTSSHYTATRTLDAWLKEQRIPGIYGVDTRAITKLIRNHGAMLGKVVVDGSRQADDMDFHDPNTTSLSASVSRKQKQVFEPPARKHMNARLRASLNKARRTLKSQFTYLQWIVESRITSFVTW